MKKTLIALALVSLPVAASAEVILYGNIRAGVEFVREGTSAQPKSVRNAWGVVDYGSYIGFKGSEDLGGNLKAIWQVEANTSLAGGSFVNNRDSFMVMGKFLSSLPSRCAAIRRASTCFKRTAPPKR